MDEHIVLQTDLSFEDVERISKAKTIAVDCEMGGLNPHRDQLYLVQIADSEHKVNLMRSNHWPQAENLKRILSDENIVKVFHFAIMDCAFLNINLSIKVRNPYCTKIASKLARTYSDSHSLKNLLDDLLGQTMDKKSQTSFWGRQKLSQEQLQYAINDTYYLIEIKHELETILEEKGMLATGITYSDLNLHCQQFIPTLVHLWLNGWDFGKEMPESLFGR